MIVKTKPKIDQKIITFFDKFLKSTNKTLPHHQRFIKNMDDKTKDMFMNYFSWKYKYDLKEYEKLKIRFKSNVKRLNDSILEMITDYKDSKVWKTDHLKTVRGITLGAMYQIQYKGFKHDKFPLAIFLNKYDSKHQNFQAINLHYFSKAYRTYFVDQILKMNQPRIAAKQVPIVTLDMVKKILPKVGMALRNYKAEEIRVIEQISHTRWTTYLEIDKRVVDFNS